MMLELGKSWVKLFVGIRTAPLPMRLPKRGIEWNNLSWISISILERLVLESKSYIISQVYQTPEWFKDSKDGQKGFYFIHRRLSTYIGTW